MSYTSLQLMPTAPAAPHAFALFAPAQSPRETYAMYDDLLDIFCRPARASVARKRSNSAPTLAHGLRKFFGIL